MIEAYYAIDPELEEGTLVITEKNSFDKDGYLDNMSDAYAKIYDAMDKLEYGEYAENYYVWNDDFDIDQLVRDMADYGIKLIHNPDLLTECDG